MTPPALLGGDHTPMGIFLAALLISAILLGYRFLLFQLVYGDTGRLAVRQARHAIIVHEAVRDIDREYEELLRR